jgi:GT2 family glycosyltransferase
MIAQISVVVPTYRRADLLIRCVNALNNQQFFLPFEIIVVSEGPDLWTEKIIGTIRTQQHVKLRFLPLPRKGGPAAARNFGWRSAMSNCIAFTDDDCIPNESWLGLLYSRFCEEQLDEIAFAGQTIVPISNPPTDYEKNIKHLETAEFITANCALSKQALEKVGGLDEQFTMAWREDSDLQFKLIQHGIPLIKVDGAVITHPVRKVSWGVCLKEENKGVFNALLFRKFPGLYKQRIQQSPPWLYYIICLSFLGFMIGIIISSPSILWSGFTVYSMATILFISKRLKGTTRTPSHVIEMVITSMMIPFLSLFYCVYRSIRYKVLLLPLRF